MDKSSFFIENKALFGSYPTQESVNELEKEGVRFFINLTYSKEKKIQPYFTKYNYINYPISDQGIPSNLVHFSCFIIKLSDIINRLTNNELLFIHCKGGHGRAGIVVACLLCYMFNLLPSESIKLTTKYHSERKIMREKWRNIGSPQTSKQKYFVQQMCEQLHFYKVKNNGYTAGFSNFSLFPVNYKNYVFPTSEAAIQATKDITNKEYVKKQTESATPIISKKLSKTIKVTQDWVENCEKYMIEILYNKFSNNHKIKKMLINTGLKPIVQTTRGDNFWGDGGDGSGKNILGKSLVKVREIFYRELIENNYYII